MKKLLLFFFVFSFKYNFIWANYGWCAKKDIKIDSLTSILENENITSEKVVYLQNARKELKSSVNEILKLENFKNKEMQKVLLTPLEDYYNAFDYEYKGRKATD